MGTAALGYNFVQDVGHENILLPKYFGKRTQRNNDGIPLKTKIHRD
jgi:hypothetical protein